MSRITLVCLTLLSLAADFEHVEASEAASTVHAVQPPAWIERAGGIVALRAGDLLLAGDVIRTGPGGRVQVDLPEGSRVKLGEAVRFRAERLRESRDAKGRFFDAAFDVLKGAFRFTTGLAGHERRREVSFRVGTVTAGIRGTDIWGKAMDDGTDMVLLIDGQAEIAMPGHAAMMMSTPLHGVMMMPAGDMQMIETLPMETLQQYARETEMNEDRAMMMTTGEWQLVVMSLRNRERAIRVQQDLVQAGYPAEIDATVVNGKDRYRVVLSCFASLRGARMQGDALTGSFGIREYWVRRD